jgi:predicted phage tail component-like protein
MALPYLILNGVSSKNITGLLIQSLPPISKPKIRTSVEEIDGRDGDIVTTLGYAAYDKPISIGLKGDYNVDDVIEYFNGSGQVIFSNELDKYYNYAIYDTIDFNRLIRFRTATLNMHVQPFKYSVDEPPIKWTNTNGTTIANISVRNTGNIYSKPTLTITGSGTVNIYLDNTQILELALSAAGETIIIDVESMNATDNDGNYLNRQVTGDYDNLILAVGSNNLRVTGTLTSITIYKYSRWI